MKHHAYAAEVDMPICIHCGLPEEYPLHFICPCCGYPNCGHSHHAISTSEKSKPVAEGQPDSELERRQELYLQELLDVKGFDGNDIQDILGCVRTALASRGGR
jgi:hypothetical protein